MGIERGRRRRKRWGPPPLASSQFTIDHPTQAILTKNLSQNSAGGCQSRTGRGGRPGDSEQQKGFGTCFKNDAFDDPPSEAYKGAVTMATDCSAADEGPLQWEPCEPGQGGNTAAISLRYFVWGPLVGGRSLFLA